ncbi:hypothetical protein CLAFUR4_14478 [Fulvia fulva]|nr:hypothetical protein CLAFUR4_14478 [Fulvia fulva]WPV37744.1 hypothetical protein CLAFUW7_14487 [Fulvia fulva]
MSWTAYAANMDAKTQDDTDKENAAPAGYDAHYPPLPLNSKGNIVMKHPYSNASDRGKPSAKSKTSRRRRNVEVLTETPPRPSRSSQISKIFAREANPKGLVASSPLHSPTGIPDEAMRVYEHFSQAMRNAAPKTSKQATTPKSKGKGKRKTSSGQRTPRSLRKPDSKRSVPPPSPASSPADSDRVAGLQRVDSGCDLRSLSAAELAEHWPAITSAPRSDSPPPVTSKHIPDPDSSPIAKPRNEPAPGREESVYPDLQDVIQEQIQIDQARAHNNTLDAGDRLRRLGHLHSHLQTPHYPTPWMPAPRHQISVGNSDPTQSNLTSASFPHSIDRLTLINRKLARTDLSPQHRGDRISFLAESDQPINEFELAIASSFSSTSPGLAERRKTLNIKVTDPSPPRRVATMPIATTVPVVPVAPQVPDDDDDSSTDSWTGDEVFFPRPAAPQPVPPPPASQRSIRPPFTRAETESTIWQNRRPPPPPLLSPMRAVRSSRFHVPEIRGRVCGPPRDVPYAGRPLHREVGPAFPGELEWGVPLSMEEHPSSAGSDADGEDDSDGEE